MALPLPKVVADVEAGGPYVTAMRGRNALQELMLMNQAKQIENQFAPEKNRLANENQFLKNFHQGKVNEWYDPNIKSEINLRNQQSQHIPFQNELLSAQAANTRSENQFMPLKYQISNRNSLTNQDKVGQSQQNAFRNWIKTPEGQQIVKNRPDIANAILRSVEKGASSIVGNESPLNYAQNNNIENRVNENISSNSLPKDSSRMDLIKDIQRGAADAYEKINLPADTKKRLYAGARFKSSVPSVMENAQLASVYFGPEGQVRLKKDQARAGIDKRVSPNLQAYRKFHQGLEQLKVQGAFLEGVPADQISRKAYSQVYDISNFFTNPTDAMDQLKYAIDLAMMADEANTSSLSEVKNSKEKKSDSKNIDIRNMSDEELQRIAYG